MSVSGEFLVLLCAIMTLIGASLSMYPNWRLVAAINIVIFASFLSVELAGGGRLFPSLLIALVPLFALSAAFVGSSLLLEHSSLRSSAQDTTDEANESRSIDNGRM